MVDVVSVFAAKDGADLVDKILRQREYVDTALDSRYDARGYTLRNTQITIGSCVAGFGRIGNNRYSITLLYPFEKISLEKHKTKFLELAEKYGLLCVPASDGQNVHLFSFYKEIAKLFRKSKRGEYVGNVTSNSVLLDISFEKAREFAKDIFDLYVQANNKT